MGGSDDTHL